jgi:Methyltransferase domain
MRNQLNKNFTITMNKIIKIILGVNLMSFYNLFSAGYQAWLRACWKSFYGAWGHIDQIPEITISEILKERKSEIKLSISKHEDGRLPDDQALCIAAIAVAENPSEILEIGTFMGHTTRLLAINIPNATIHTLDLPESYSLSTDAEKQMPKDDFHLIAKRTVGREYRSLSCASKVVQHFGDSANWDFTEAGKSNFFFIDGAHTYQYCKNDSEKCFALCGGKGVFIWHDCDRLHPGVVKFVTEWRKLGRDLRRISGTPLIYWKNI